MILFTFKKASFKWLLLASAAGKPQTITINGIRPSLNPSGNRSIKVGLLNTSALSCFLSHKYSMSLSYANMDSSHTYLFCTSAALQCPILLPPSNGMVDVPSRIVGSIATYSCKNRFTLLGDAQRECLSDETWSGDFPVCLSKLPAPHLHTYPVFHISQ